MVATTGSEELQSSEELPASVEDTSTRQEVKPSAGGWLGDLSRRAFLRRGTVTAAALGVVASVPGLSGMLAAGSSEAPAVETTATEAESDVGALSEPLIAHVKDINTGEISLFRGTEQIVVRDPALARRLLSASKP